MSVGKEAAEETPNGGQANGQAEGVDPRVPPPGADAEGTPVVERSAETPEQQQIAALRAEVEQARSAQEQATARLRTVSKAYTELQSEMKAFKERMEHRAKLDSELQAFDQVKAFFEPVMNLRRSLAATGDDQALRGGLKMVEHQFMEALQRLGLSEVPGVGAKFDPNVHEALAVSPVAEADRDGVVLEVYTAGYAVGSRVLQAAQVVIGKHEGAAGEA